MRDGIDDIVHDEEITAAGDVIEATAQSEVVAEEVESFFELQVEREVIRKALSARSADQLLLRIQEAERKTGASFHCISDFELVNDREFEQRQISPGKKAVGSIPRIRTGLLRAQDRTIDIEIECLIGVSAGARVGAHHHVGFVEVAPQGDLKRVVAVVAGVFEEEIAARGVVASVIDESARSFSLKIFRLEIDGGRKLFFEGNAPVDKARSEKRVGVRSKCCRYRTTGGDTSGRSGAVGIDGEKGIFTSACERPGDQKNRRGFVDDPDTGGELGIARVVEDVSGGEARCNVRLAHDLIPIETHSGLDEQTIGDTPPVFGVGGDFCIVLLVERSNTEGRVAGAGE